METPVCPDCNETMVKAWIETHDNSGWYCGWLCECSMEDYVQGTDSEVLANAGYLREQGQLVMQLNRNGLEIV